MEKFNSITLGEYKRFIRNFNGYEKDIIGTDYTSCWAFAYFFHKKFGLPVKDYECVYEKDISPDELEEALEHDGIYSFFTSNNTEFHHFIILLKENKIELISTYGGQQGLIQKKYNKLNFIRDLSRIFSEGNTKLYFKLFGIKKKCNIDLTEGTLSCTYRKF